MSDTSALLDTRTHRAHARVVINIDIPAGIRSRRRAASPKSIVNQFMDRKCLDAIKGSQLIGGTRSNASYAILLRMYDHLLIESHIPANSLDVRVPVFPG